MGLIGGTLAIRLLNVTSRNGTAGFPDVATAYVGRSKLETLFGHTLWDRIQYKDVLDFGCGPRAEAVEMAGYGAARVFGLDIRDHWLDMARTLAQERGVAYRCTFVKEWHEPYAHLLLPERALVQWRSLYKHDGAKTIEESGLNRMTVKRFEQLVAASPFRFTEFKAVPIRRLRGLSRRLTREFTTAVVRCVLVPR